MPARTMRPSGLTRWTSLRGRLAAKAPSGGVNGAGCPSGQWTAPRIEHYHLDEAIQWITYRWLSVMVINRSHIPWAMFVTLVTGGAATLYVANFHPERLPAPIRLPSYFGEVPPT